MPYLKCVDEEEAKYILEKIHEGICGDYAGPRSLVGKVIIIGYFWPTLQVDAREFIKKCNKCRECPAPPSREIDTDNLPMALCIMGN